MKIWKIKEVHWADITKELNNLEKKHAVIREITQNVDRNWFTIFYTVEDDVEEENIYICIIF